MHVMHCARHTQLLILSFVLNTNIIPWFQGFRLDFVYKLLIDVIAYVGFCQPHLFYCVDFVWHTLLLPCHAWSGFASNTPSVILIYNISCVYLGPGINLLGCYRLLAFKINWCNIWIEGLFPLPVGHSSSLHLSTSHNLLWCWV